MVRKKWRHLDFWQHRTELIVRMPRIQCQEQGICQGALPRAAWQRIHPDDGDHDPASGPADECVGGGDHGSILGPWEFNGENTKRTERSGNDLPI